MKYVDSHSFSIVGIAFFTNKLYASFLRGERKVYTKDRTQLLLQQQNINLQLEKQKERTLFVGLISFCILLLWSDIYKTIDLVYNGFYSHISRKYTGVLNEKELQLCCLLRSDFSTKEISVVTQQSIRTVYQRKTVIRQKLGMEEKEDIAKFLSEK